MLHSMPSVLTINSKWNCPERRNDYCRVSPYEFHFVRTNFGPSIKLFRHYAFSSVGTPDTIRGTQFKKHWCRVKGNPRQFRMKDFLGGGLCEQCIK